MSIDLYANKKGFSRHNITYIELYGTCHTRRYAPYGNESVGMSWDEETLGCDDITSLKHKRLYGKNTMTNKQMISKLKDNAELAQAAYGYFHLVGKKLVIRTNIKVEKIRKSLSTTL